jgi:hypothetical protein
VLELAGAVVVRENRTVGVKRVDSLNGAVRIDEDTERALGPEPALSVASGTVTECLRCTFKSFVDEPDLGKLEFGSGGLDIAELHELRF